MTKIFVLYLLVQFIKLSWSLTEEVDDPCLDALFLGSLDQRVVGYSLADNETAISDNILHKAWYKISSGYTLANSSEPCGTYYNWWLKDTLPSNGSAFLTVCLNYGGNECHTNKTINVTSCSQGHVYELTPTDAAFEAYCIDGKGETKIDPCLDALFLGSLDQRIVGYSLADNETAISDNILHKAWYKLLSGYTLANSSEPCGTYYNWWLKDTLPSNGSAFLTVCLNYGGNECHTNKTINVTSCSQGHVYELTPTDAAFEAYCIDGKGETKIGNDKK